MHAGWPRRRYPPPRLRSLLIALASCSVGFALPTADAGHAGRGPVTTAVTRQAAPVIKLPAQKEARRAAPSPFFVHRATRANTSGNTTTIDHPLTNGNPRAIIVITPNWNPGGNASGVYDNHPVGVWYTEQQRWAIFNQDKAPMPVGAAFNVAVMSEIAQAAMQPQPPAPASAGAAADQRSVRPDGSVEIRHADNSALIVAQGSITRVAPDGSQQKAFFVNVQPNVPPHLPNEPVIVNWLTAHNQRLLELIGTAAVDGQVSVDNYLRTEGAGLSLYQQVESRRAIVARMLAR